MKYLRLSLTLLFVAVVLTFVSSPAKYMQSFVDGLTVWAYNVLPAIFPFSVLTTLTLKLQTQRKHSLTKKLFGVDCDGTLLCSALCGYPIGAKAISESTASCETATAMCAFCSTAGPVFMLATVGGKLLQNTAATAILVTVHFAAAFLNGLIFRTKNPTEQTVDVNRPFVPADVGETVTNSALSIISVGGLIALFYMLCDMAKSFLPSKAANSVTCAFVMGLFEMTNGILGVCKSTDVATATVLSSALLSFGGLCVFAQTYAFVGKKKIRPLALLKMKMTQSAIATILSFVFVNIFLL